MNQATTHSHYPVIDDDYCVRGIVTAEDIVGHDRQVSIEKVMTKNPMVVHKSISVAAAAHMMVWEGIKCLPVVDSNHTLLGVTTRHDILKALQVARRQPQLGVTLDDLIFDQVKECTNHPGEYVFTVMPQMTSHLGALSYGVMMTVVTMVARLAFRKQKKGDTDTVIENVSFYFLKPVQIDNVIRIKPKILDGARRYGKIDIEMYHDGLVVGKALVTAQFIDRY